MCSSDLQTRNCSKLLVDTYRDAYATCQSIAARGQPPVFQNTPRPESDTIDLQCAMLLEETYRRGFRTCREDLRQTGEGAPQIGLPQKPPSLPARSEQPHVVGVRYRCENTDPPSRGTVMRVSMLSNGGITRVPVSDSIRVNGYSYPWQIGRAHV